MSETNFREMIKELIEEKNISIAKLSRLVDLNSATLYNYMQGKSELTAANLEKVIDVLNNF